MNKSVIIAVVAIILVLLGVGGFLVLSNKNQSPVQTSNNTSSETNPANALSSLKDLFASGSSQECSFSDATGNSGTVFVSGGKMRGDFVSTSAQGTINSHMIIDNNTSYLWMDGQPTGFKMSFDVNAQAQATAPNQGFDINQQVDYDCKAWSGGSTSFTLPTGVTFNDLGALTVPVPTEAGASGAPSNTKAQQCAACDSAPETYRAQCKAALGCS